VVVLTDRFAMQAIVTLCALYKDAAQWGNPYETEAEFRSYALLLSMGTHGKYEYQPDACASALRVRPPSPTPVHSLQSPPVLAVIADDTRFRGEGRIRCMVAGSVSHSEYISIRGYDQAAPHPPFCGES
jgi:hypothetical protein